MKALVFHGPGDCRVQEVDKPRIGAGELLVAVRYAGVCGTDVRIFAGTKKVEPPRIIGHEFSGEVAEAGAGVQGFSLGDRVTVYPVIFCNECYACKAGRKNICVNRQTIGYEYDGGFAEYVRIPAKAVTDGNVIPLPDAVSFKEAAISEMAAAAYNGIVRAQIRDGDTLVIVGAGPIGLCHVMLSKAKNPGQIIVSEPDMKKRELARELGADETVNPSEEDPRERIFDLTDGDGADKVIVDVGLPEVIAQSLEYLKKGGDCILFAGSPAGSRISIDPNLIHYKEIRFTGSSASLPDYQREVLDYTARGILDLKRLISDVFPLEDFKEAFERKRDYVGLKSVFAIRPESLE